MIMNLEFEGRLLAGLEKVIFKQRGVRIIDK
jgi:hypothetical protein